MYVSENKLSRHLITQTVDKFLYALISFSKTSPAGNIVGSVCCDRNDIV